jgi:DNA-binding response OmpR family regulator
MPLMTTESEVSFTPTQRRMLLVLADGLPHRPQELHACLHDDLGPLSNIRWHIGKLREKLRPLGQDIVCEVNCRRFYYRHVKLLG